MKVLIVEAEIMAQKSLVRALSQNCHDMEVIGTATSVKGAVAWLKEHGDEVDIIFMDVELSDGNCFEIFSMTQVNAKVMITTAYDSYALKAFEASMPRKDYKERYIIRINDRIVPLQTAEIAYVYSEDKNNYLVTFDGQRYIIDSSLDMISEELNPDYFFRISRGCIVSMKAIRTIIKQMGGRLRIIARPEPSFEMTVSRSRSDDFMAWLER